MDGHDPQPTPQIEGSGEQSLEPTQSASQDPVPVAETPPQAAPSPYGGGGLYAPRAAQQPQTQPQAQPQPQPQQVNQHDSQQPIPEQYMQPPSQINIPAVLGYIHEQQQQQGNSVQSLQETIQALKEAQEQANLENYRAAMVSRWDNGVKEMKGRYDEETAKILEDKLGEYLEDSDSIIHRAVRREPEALQELVEAYVLKNEIDPQKLAANTAAVAQMQQGMLNQLNSAPALGNIPATPKEEDLFEWGAGDSRLTADSWDE